MLVRAVGLPAFGALALGRATGVKAADAGGPVATKGRIKLRSYPGATSFLARNGDWIRSARWQMA